MTFGDHFDDKIYYDMPNLIAEFFLRVYVN